MKSLRPTSTFITYSQIISLSAQHKKISKLKPSSNQNDSSEAYEAKSMPKHAGTVNSTTMVAGNGSIKSSALSGNYTKPAMAEKRYDNEDAEGAEHQKDWVLVMKSFLENQHLQAQTRQLKLDPPIRFADNHNRFVSRRLERRGATRRNRNQKTRPLRKFKPPSELEEQRKAYEALNPLTFKDDKEYALGMQQQAGMRNLLSMTD
ncbi:hypothetical protein NHQ30_011531 [Ciborinia camelliae]|nr:hypothetical protein NHQ30_011531 [Ciborinia camelliae]